MEELLEMMKTFNALDILEMDVEKDGMKINMRKMEPPYISPNRYNFVMESNIPQAQPLVSAQAPVTKKADPVEPEVKKKIIKSITVGAFKLSPETQVGKVVKKGEVLARIEALSISNEVLSEVDGTLLEIKVQPNQLIEYGEELFQIQV